MQKQTVSKGSQAFAKGFHMDTFPAMPELLQGSNTKE